MGFWPTEEISRTRNGSLHAEAPIDWCPESFFFFWGVPFDCLFHCFIYFKRWTWGKGVSGKQWWIFLQGVHIFLIFFRHIRVLGFIAAAENRLPAQPTLAGDVGVPLCQGGHLYRRNLRFVPVASVHLFWEEEDEEGEIWRNRRRRGWRRNSWRVWYWGFVGHVDLMFWRALLRMALGSIAYRHLVAALRCFFFFFWGSRRKNLFGRNTME